MVKSISTGGGKQFAISYWVICLVVLALDFCAGYYGVRYVIKVDTGFACFIGLSIPIGIGFTALYALTLYGSETVMVTIPAAVWRWVMIIALVIGVLICLAGVLACSVFLYGFLQFFT